MIDIKQVQSEIEASPLFQKWKKEHDVYLVHFFCMDEKEVQVGYYDEKEDVLTTFVKAEEITKKEDKEIFRQEKKIAPLEIGVVKITLQDAMQRIEAIQKQEYHGDMIAKKIIVLQTLNNVPTYNITLITMTFKMINIRIDARTGSVLEEKMQPIMDFMQTIENKNSKR